MTFARSGLTTSWSDRYASILELAEACDVPTQWSCRTGVCHTCVTAVLSGEASYEVAPLEAPGRGRAPDLLGAADRGPRHRPLIARCTSLLGLATAPCDRIGDCGTRMPWLPELFTAPVLQQILDERRRDELVAVPYFDGLMAGDPDPLVESFAGEPEVHDPVRGRIKGVAAFRAFVTETSAWLREHNVSVEDVEHVILDRRGFEEVVLHLDSANGTVGLPVAIVADRRPDGRIEELRVYFTSGPLTGRRATARPCCSPTPS